MKKLKAQILSLVLILLLFPGITTPIESTLSEAKVDWSAFTRQHYITFDKLLISSTEAYNIITKTSTMLLMRTAIPITYGTRRER